MTQLEYDIQQLEDKQNDIGLTAAEKKRLQDLQDEWYEQELAQRGCNCPNCFI